jgi:uncharacterized protein DUF6916
MGRTRPAGSGRSRLLLRGPAHVVAPQRIYPLEHQTVGTHELFVVPLGPGQGGMLYEIIFT